ncbi:MAG: flagellar basal body P-ring protein FlgI [Gammaproteobacteria bacterium]
MEKVQLENMPSRFLRNLLVMCTLLAWSVTAQADRIKDLASVAGMRDNQLVGYGLVVGLDGSGDKVNQVFYTEQSLKNMLSQLGVVVPDGIRIKPKNVAAVMVHAQLPPFIKKGQKIDVTVSSVGNAKSLRGGTLLMAPLKGINGKVYAIAQGDLVVGGLGVEGADGSSVTVNIPSVGRIPRGAIVERPVVNSIGNKGTFTLNLHSADFTTASRMSEAINAQFGLGTANALDPVSVEVVSPRDTTQRIEFLSMVENLTLQPGEASARVVINSRTGTVVISNMVRVTPAAVAHGSLVVTITEDELVSQPFAPFSQGATTEVVQDTQIDIEQEQSHMFVFEPGVDLNDIVRAVNEVGAAPGDLVAILEALKAAGALRAELLVI